MMIKCQWNTNVVTLPCGFKIKKPAVLRVTVVRGSAGMRGCGYQIDLNRMTGAERIMAVCGSHGGLNVPDRVSNHRSHFTSDRLGDRRGISGASNYK